MHVRTTLAIVLAGCCAVLASCTATVPRSDPSTQADTTAPDAPVRNGDSLTWHDCRSGFQCSSLAVPLDWSHPAGTKIDLALIRKPARKANPIGSLLFNPGGPGEPGTDFLRQFLETGDFPDELADRFDLVSWDPRGTGGSAGIACLTDHDYTEPDPLPYPPTAAAREAVVDHAMAQQQRCLAQDGAVIRHVGTTATVRDVDAIRSAVGYRKLDYVGFSYGTTIGLEYLRMFPDHVGKMVLDGVALPGQDPVDATRRQMTSFEDSLDRFLDDCAADQACEFGAGDPRAALMTFLDHLATGERIPASYSLPDESGTRHERTGTLGYTEAVTGIAAALYSESSWPILRSGLAAATRPENPDGRILLMLRDLLQGRRLDGSWNHSVEANTAISCADQSARSTSFFGSPARIAAWGAAMPVFGRFGAVGLPGCYRWPAALDPLRPLTADDLSEAPPVVVVNSAHDPATPYANAVEATALLPRARLVTWGGDDHTSFAGGHRCIDAAVVPYLLDGTMPPAGKRCHD